jgi:carboxyl-terminal processing protease
MKYKRYILVAIGLVIMACAPVTRLLGFSDETSVPQNDLPMAESQDIYIPPLCQDKPIATIPAATTVARPTSSLDANPQLSESEQLYVFDQIVATIDEYYLYPDFNGLDWSSTKSAYRAKVESGLDTETFYSEMENLLIELGDEHSYFQSPVQVAEMEAIRAGFNNYTGIGVTVFPLNEKNKATVLFVFPDSPAEHAGLKPHDSILAIDGLPIIENGIEYLHRLRGPECSATVLTVQTPGEPQRIVTLVRYPITTTLRIDARLVPINDGSKVGYIFIPSFIDETIPDQIQNALVDFGPLDGLILDNRFNGGGSLFVMETILSYFTEGTLGQYTSKTTSTPLNITSQPINNSETVPLVILISFDTGSSGEIFSGALMNNGRAELVGQTTQGNVELVFGYTFSDGSEAWIAQERFYPVQSHADWETYGVTPDVEADTNWDTFTFDNDPSIEAALDLLGHN